MAQNTSTKSIFEGGTIPTHQYYTLLGHVGRIYEDGQVTLQDLKVAIEKIVRARYIDEGDIENHIRVVEVSFGIEVKLTLAEKEDLKVKELFEAGYGKIKAIKYLRNHFNMALRDAKLLSERAGYDWTQNVS